MLVGTDEIGRPGRRIEALRKQARLVKIIFADDGERHVIGQPEPITVGKVAVRAVLHVDDLEAAAQAFRGDGLLSRPPRTSGASGSGAPSLAVPANGAASGVVSGES